MRLNYLTVTKILATVLMIILIVSTSPSLNDYEGSGEIIIIIEGNHYPYSYYMGNHEFVHILKENHHVLINNGILYELDDLSTNFIDDYIVIYFNGMYSYYGILELPLCNMCVYEFKIEEVK